MASSIYWNCFVENFFRTETAAQFFLEDKERSKPRVEDGGKLPF